MTILIVDDNETDRKVLRNILERAGIQSVEAEDGVEALTVLERERVDAVICDVLMPNMDGYQFCYELRQSLIHRRLPVVIYTSHFANENMGQISREFGADLFLRKPASPDQIMESIRMAREAQTRQTLYSPLKLPEIYRDKKTYSEWLIRKLEEQNNELERSEQRYRHLVELSPDGVVVICEGEIIFINGAGARILGAATTREIEGRQVMDFIHPDFKQVILSRTKNLLQGKLERNPPLEQKLVRLHGGLVEVETMSTSFRFFDKPAILVLVRDITLRKEAERRLRESEFFIKESQLAAFIGSYKYDFQKDIWESSEVMDQIFGIDHAYPHNAKGWLDIVHPDDREMMGNYLREEVQLKRRPFEKEYRIVRKSDGKIRWVFGLGKVGVDSRGDVVSMVGTIQDITERKEAEFRLRESERALTTLVSNLSGFAYRCKNDSDWTMEYISEGVLALTGYPSSDFLSQNVTYNSIIHPEDRVMVWRDIQQALQENRPFQIVYRIRTAAKDVRWFWEQGRGVFGSDGRLLALEGFITDITDRQKFELALQRSESNYRILMEQASDAIMIADAQGYYIDANASACELFGYTKDELLRKRLGDLSDSAEPPVLSDLLSLPAGHSHVAERKFRRKDGGLLIIEVHGKKLPDGRIQGVYHDITERKRVEEELRRSEANYRMLMEHAADAIIVVDSATWRYVDANDKACKLLGYGREELFKKKLGELSRTNPEIIRHAIGDVMAGNPYTGEYRVQHQDGTFIDVEINATLLPDGRIYGMFRDITKRKKSEEVLRSEQAFIQKLADLLPSIVYVYDLIERKPFYVNRAAGGILGYTPAALKDMGPGFIGKVMHPEDAALYQERVRKFATADDGAIVENEYRLRHFDGAWRRFQCHEIIFNRDPDGRPRLILGIARELAK